MENIYKPLLQITKNMDNQKDIHMEALLSHLQHIREEEEAAEKMAEELRARLV